MLLRRTVAATVWPITVAEAKEQIRQDVDADNVLIGALIPVAVQAVGEMAGRVLAAETWEMSVASVTGDLVLPKRPVNAVTGISYYDTQGAEQTATVSDFYLFKDGDKAYLRPKSGGWPAMQVRDDALTVTFTCGGNAPDELIWAARLYIGMLYDNRGDEKPMGLSPALEALVGLHRVGWVAS